MKINQLLLKSATDPIRGLIPKNPLVPYYAYILIKTTESGLEVRYTNQEASYKTILTEGYEGEFNLCIDATLVEALVEVDVFLSFKVEEHRCVVTAKRRKMTLPIMDVTNYPVEIAENKLLFHANSTEIKKAIDKCNGFGVAESDNAFHGVRFSSVGDKLEVGATDKIAAVYSILNVSANKEFGFNVKTQLCNIIKDMCDNDELIHVLESDRDVQWSCGGSVFTTRKNDYAKALVPYSSRLSSIGETTTDEILISDRKWFIESLRTSILFADPTHTFVTISLNSNEITLNVHSEKGKSVEQSVECLFDKNGDSTHIILNYNLFIRILGKLTGDDVTLRLAPDGDPIATGLYINEGDSHFFLWPFVTR